MAYGKGEPAWPHGRHGRARVAELDSVARVGGIQGGKRRDDVAAGAAGGSCRPARVGDC